MQSLGVAYETFRPDVTDVPDVDPPNPPDYIHRTSGQADAVTITAPSDVTVAAAPLSAVNTTNTTRTGGTPTVTTVDILVIFTAAAAAALGGQTATINKITAEVGISNQIYINSKLDVRLNLVKASLVRGGHSYVNG